MALFGFRSEDRAPVLSDEERRELEDEADRRFQADVIAASHDKPVLLLLADADDGKSSKFRQTLQRVIGEFGNAVTFVDFPRDLAPHVSEQVGFSTFPLALGYAQGEKIDMLYSDVGSKDRHARKFLNALISRSEELNAELELKRQRAIEMPALFEKAEAFFADRTSIVSFDVASYFASEGIRDKHYKAFYEKFQPTQKGLQLSGSGPQLAAGAFGAIATAWQAGAVASDVGERIRYFRAERSLFFMNEQERDIFRHMKLLSICGAISDEVYGRFERGIIFNGGNCVLVPTHQADDKTGLAQFVLTEFLNTRLMSPMETLHHAIRLFNDVKQGIAADKAGEEAAKGVPALPREADLEAVQKVIDDI